MEPTRLAVSATPFFFAAASTPSTSAALRCFKLLIDSRSRFQLSQRRDPGCHGQRISGERSCLIHRTERRNHVHQLCAAAISADRQPAADDLAERGEIGLDLVELLRAAKAETKAGHYFIENQAPRLAAQ